MQGGGDLLPRIPHDQCRGGVPGSLTPPLINTGGGGPWKPSPPQFNPGGGDPLVAHPPPGVNKGAQTNIYLMSGMVLEPPRSCLAWCCSPQPHKVLLTKL